jgi:hypothetical protein
MKVSSAISRMRPDARGRLVGQDGAVTTYCVTFTGPASLAARFASMLQAEGLAVSYEPPPLHRSGGAAAAEATVELVVSGLAFDAVKAAVKAAATRFTKRFPGGSTITLDGAPVNEP